MIRNASVGDFLDILNIKKRLALDVSRLSDNNYRISREKEGFLIPSGYTQQEFNVDLQKTFLVFEQDGKVVGFLRIDEEQELRPTTQAEWLIPELKDVYFSNPHADIGGIAVLPEFAHHGIATQMLIEAEKEVRGKKIPYLFSLVPFAPIANHPSIKFHEHNEFQKVAITEPHPLFGMTGYQSILFGKKL